MLHICYYLLAYYYLRKTLSHEGGSNKSVIECTLLLYYTTNYAGIAYKVIGINRRGIPENSFVRGIP